MTEFTRILQECGDTVVRELSRKTESAVLQMKRPDGTQYILRFYSYAVPAYAELTGHTCENLPKIYRAFEKDGLFVVEEEYVDGISLQIMLSGGARMDEKRTCDIACKICEAASYLHAAGFIHRDIKPEHVMLAEDGRVLLIDLDSAMRISLEKKNDTQLLGTAMYAAPEQFGLSRSDARTDVYAVGILLNEMMTGAHPAVVRYQEGRLQKIIDRCTQMNPADRYQTMGELGQALTETERTEKTAAGKQKWKWAAKIYNNLHL